MTATLIALLLAPTLARPQSSATTIPRGPLTPFRMETLAVFAPDSGVAPMASRRLGDAFEETTWHGHRALRRESTVIGDDGKVVRWEITISDALTLLPYSSEWRRADGLFIHREFDGMRVTETRSSVNLFTSPRLTPGQHVDTLSTSFTLSEPAYDWVGGAGLPVLLGLTFHDGMDGSVPVISAATPGVTPCFEGPCVVSRMTYHASGPEMVESITGTRVLAWKVDVPETHFTFWITNDHPRLAAVSWPGKGGRFTMTAAGTRP